MEICPKCGLPIQACVCGEIGKSEQKIRVELVKRKYGKIITLVSGFKDIDITPSQGSHFFQNITSFRVGYFTVNATYHQGFIDWKWLGMQKAFNTLSHVRHLRFEKPIIAKINGRKNKGVIVKPGT